MATPTSNKPEWEKPIKEAFNSPKAGAVLLAIGSPIWKMVAVLSNVDFILSVREERVAVILESLLDWGWIVLLAAAIIWAFVAPLKQTDKTSMSWGMAIAVGVLCFMGGALVTTAGAGTYVPNILTQWNVNADYGCSGVIDSSKLVGWKKKYKILLVCGVSDPMIDPIDNTNIGISAPFTITGQAIAIQTSPGSLLNVINKMPPNSGAFMWHTVALVPFDEDISELKRLGDIEKRGGLFLSQPGSAMSGFGKPPEAPPAPQPAQPAHPAQPNKVM